MNIYVGNLNYTVTEDELRGIFEEFGQVESAKIILDKLSGRSKGFGFVEMTDEDAGKEAVEELNGADLRGRNIKVNFANERENRGNDRRGGGGGFNRGGGGYNRGGDRGGDRRRNDYR